MRNPSVWSWLAVALGLLLRLYHYLRCPAVWQDEAALMVNVLRLPMSSFLGPLEMTQAAPPFFLVIEKALIIIAGDSEWTLRFFPFITSCLGLILFRQILIRVVTPWWAAVGVLMFATSDRLLWHSCEAKPYAVDVFVSVIVAYWSVRTASWSLSWRCLPMVLVAPILIWLSFPSCFVLGGLLVGLLPSLRHSNWFCRIAYVLLLVSIGIAFMTLVLGPAASQRNQELDHYWADHFPNWQRPLTVPGWITISTFEVARYCYFPLGFLLVPYVIIGGWRMAVRGDAQLFMAILPWGLLLIAALLKKYPYSCTRLEVFLTPGLIWLSVEGLSAVFPRVANWSRSFAILILFVLLFPVGLAISRVINPWPRDASDTASSFVLQQKQQSDVVVFNHWEYEYYFRNASSSARFWSGAFQPSETVPEKSKSLWVIHNSKPVLEQYPFPMPAGWNVAEVHAFEGLRVFRLKAD